MSLIKYSQMFVLQVICDETNRGSPCAFYFSIEWVWLSGYEILHHGHTTPCETPQSIFILREPLQFLHRCEQGAACISFAMWEEHKAASVFSKMIIQLQEIKFYLNLHLLQVISTEPGRQVFS